MENENNTVEVIAPPPDFTELEQSITDLVEVIQTEQEIKAEEKIQNETTNTENSQAIANLQGQLSALQENQTLLTEAFAEQSAMIAGAFEELNANTLVLIEKTDLQNDLITEGSFMVTLALVIAISVKIFIDQISKW